MPSRTSLSFAKLLVLVMLCVSAVMLVAQTESAKISGLVTDSSGAVVAGADVLLQNTEQGTTSTVMTNNEGIYVLPSVRPGQYRISVKKDGFRSVDVLGMVVNVQDRIEENVRLQPGSVSESVTVTGGAPSVSTEDATVSTVVDRNFAENIPMNGRSFQTLIELAPGVVPLAAGANHGDDSGQFSVNGQRGAANYWMVDGVSGNVGSNTLFGGNQMSGAAGTTSVFGGTNSLVSVDAMQEFRIQTSTFAPEFGRTPGAQISIVTRSGGNQFHGAAFDYLRNDLLDANNWFNGYTNLIPLPKAEERQNDFGGTFSGPILRDRTFFFFSYEGLRLRLPTTTLTTVPDASARESATPAMQPFLNAFPLDPRQQDLGNGVAQLNASYSNPAALDAYSLRVDHKATNRLTLFGRYNYSPSQIVARASSVTPLSTLVTSSSTSQQGTAGITANVSARFTNEFRINYSETNAAGVTSLDGFGGAVPVTPAFPSPYTVTNSLFIFFIVGLNHGEVLDGPSIRNVQRQFNVVNTTAVQEGAHSLKFGLDYRRLSPIFEPNTYSQLALFLDVPSAASGQLLESIAQGARGGTVLFRNLGLFAQDTWRVVPRFTVTYGLRWDTDFAPSTIIGPALVALSGVNLNDLSTLSLAPRGTSPFNTRFGNVAPRLGAAYQLSRRPDWGLVARGGFGVFYDLATSEAGNLIPGIYPFSGPLNIVSGGAFPLNSVAAAAPPISPPTAANPTELHGFDPSLRSPYTLEWNAALEQQLGPQQSLKLSYVGAVGRSLLQSLGVIAPTPAITFVDLVTNSATSDYHALQAEFQRRLANNLQAISSYTWSHSIDTASAGSTDFGSNAAAAAGNPGNRGPSAFDIRHSVSVGITYSIPAIESQRLFRYIARGWALQSIVQAHTGSPVEVSYRNASLFANKFDAAVRPDVVPGIPLYLYGPQFPGGKAINNTPGAVLGGCPDGSPSIGPFCRPPTDSDGFPLREGSLGRNALRGFRFVQWDLGVHRDFPIGESVKLQFRAEMFNILNHPNFAPPAGDLSLPTFGQSSQMLNDYLGSGAGVGGFSALYQIGGPRSMQLALKLRF
jgi:hypothetical protein